MSKLLLNMNKVRIKGEMEPLPVNDCGQRGKLRKVLRSTAREEEVNVQLLLHLGAARASRSSRAVLTASFSEEPVCPFPPLHHATICRE